MGTEGGRGFLIRAAWLAVNALVFLNPVLPAYGLKARILRAFGARIGEGVIIKPSVNIKYPWFLAIGEYSWIGERAWLDCLSPPRSCWRSTCSQGCPRSCSAATRRRPTAPTPLAAAPG